MFEFAISQQRSRPPTRRFLGALVISLISHFGALTLLAEYPWLLGTGLKNWLRQPVFFGSTAPKEPAWRTVTFVGKGGKMDMPAAETLRKNTYDWAGHKPGAPPPIRIRWGGELAESKPAPKEPVPAVKPVPGLQEPKPIQEGVRGGADQLQTNAGQAPGEGANGSGGESAAGKGATVYLPPPQPTAEPKQIPKKAPETASNVAPASIPTEKPGAPAPPAGAAKAPQNKSTTPQVFESQDKAIKSEGSGLFDTKGFPLGDYASLIIERVKGNWSIPSNLRNSQGRTTVIFFIDKDGRFTDARIVSSSGSSSLDLAALNAIIGSNPFPPLPKGFPGDHVGAKFVFSYNERQ
jgi:protein TonB